MSEEQKKRPGSATSEPLDDERPAVDKNGTGDTLPREVGGRKGPDPTRYGDWEKGGRCIDF